MVSCSRFIWITNSGKVANLGTPNQLHLLGYMALWVRQLLRMQEIRNSNPGTFDPSKSWARHYCSLKLGSKLKYLNIKPEACNFNKKETLAQVFSCGFCEIFKNTFFTEDLWTTVHTFKWAHNFKHFSVHTFTKEKKQTHQNWFLI